MNCEVDRLSLLPFATESTSRHNLSDIVLTAEADSGNHVVVQLCLHASGNEQTARRYRNITHQL